MSIKNTAAVATDAFRDGMIAALAVVVGHDSETLWRDIVRTQPDLVDYARRGDDETWHWAGFDRYIGARKPLELTKRMEQSLRFIVERGGAHPGKEGHSTFRALVRRGLIEFEGWGRDDDLQIDDDVMLYRPTEAGRRYFDGEQRE